MLAFPTELLQLGSEVWLGGFKRTLPRGCWAGLQLQNQVCQQPSLTSTWTWNHGKHPKPPTEVNTQSKGQRSASYLWLLNRRVCLRFQMWLSPLCDGGAWSTLSLLASTQTALTERSCKVLNWARHLWHTHTYLLTLMHTGAPKGAKGHLNCEPDWLDCWESFSQLEVL